MSVDLAVGVGWLDLDQRSSCPSVAQGIPANVKPSPSNIHWKDLAACGCVIPPGLQSQAACCASSQCVQRRQRPATHPSPANVAFRAAGTRQKQPVGRLGGAFSEAARPTPHACLVVRIIIKGQCTTLPQLPSSVSTIAIFSCVRNILIKYFTWSSPASLFFLLLLLLMSFCSTAGT